MSKLAQDIQVLANICTEDLEKEICFLAICWIDDFNFIPAPLFTIILEYTNKYELKKNL